jgi:ATP-dependent DNA helicase UvrD/PcrA
MTKISKRLSATLNKEQQNAVATINGPLLVLAGAGTGKTRVITYRIAHMIDTGIPPENIVGLTFTNKAAKEMRERLTSVVRINDAEKVSLGTFHSFCARFLRKEITALGYNKNFTITDDSDQKGLIKQALAELNIHKDMVNSGYCISLISKTKSGMLTPYEVEIPDATTEAVFPSIYGRYQQMLKNQNMVDFDDLLLLAVKILQENKDTLKEYQEKYPYLLVDEYQDTNALQFELLELLAGTDKNLCVVGDDDQSIYGWRGAKIENILNFPEHFKGAKQIKLEQNYRSTTTILKASNSLISCNTTRHDKQLWSECGDGDDIRVIIADTEVEEAQFMADAVHDFIGKGQVLFNDIAILYRSNYQSRQIEDAMRNAQLPYRIIGSKSFYERKEIRDAVAYLKLIVNNKDDQSLLRIIGAPPRGIGDKAIERLRDLQSKTYIPMTDLLKNDAFLNNISSKAASGAQQLVDCIEKWRSKLMIESNITNNVREYLEEVGYINGLLKMYKNRDEAEKRRENVYELVNAVRQFELKLGPSATLLDFLESYSLADDNDKVDEEDDKGEAVTLMTVHAAKGLEFKAIFVIGVEENLFPNERAINEGATEEERRLFYVAMTRAKEFLTITRARSRMRYGQTTRQKQSRFLLEIPKDLIDKRDAKDAFQKVSFDAMQKAFENFSFE